MKHHVIIDSPHKSHEDFEFPMFSKSVRIRFGTIGKRKPKDIEFPNVKAITKAMNKLEMKKIFIKAGVNTPRLIPFPTVVDLPIIFKRTKHSRGRGMKIIHDLKELYKIRDNGYVEKFKLVGREFRVHVADGRVFHVDEKVPRGGRKRHRIKNLDNGYVYKQAKGKLPAMLLNESIKAVNSLGLEFGAVDIGLSGNTAWVYEVNTAMGMRTITRNKYNLMLGNIIRKKIFPNYYH